MSALVPDQLKDMWTAVEAGRISYEDFGLEQDRLLGKYRSRWVKALLLENHTDLQDSILAEISLYTGCADLEEIRQRCKLGAEAVAYDWKRIQPDNDKSIAEFYNKSVSYIYDLMWWHTLADDNSPLAYVTALEFAERNQCRYHLDFGAGVGSGNILFLRCGFESAAADISSSLIQFGRWRFKVRNLPLPTFIDLKEMSLPAAYFDIITAMDVFEHLTDPVRAVDHLSNALKPGGFLFGRFAPDAEEHDHPQHIVHDFSPTLERMRALGFVHVWQDEWLWGHQVFQKPQA
ncbi:MAG TPA: methyltransferase [Gemmataceae bacterium]|nr:methyltransferase [Gemmataceae bacterium]